MKVPYWFVGVLCFAFIIVSPLLGVILADVLPEQYIRHPNGGFPAMAFSLVGLDLALLFAGSFAFVAHSENR
jgi:hypothetical protein